MRELVERLDTLCDAVPFHASWYLKDVATGARADRHGDVAVPSASTRKISIMMAALAAVHAGKLTLDQKVTIDARLTAAGLRSSAYIQRPGPDGVFRNVVNEEHEAMRRMTQPWPTRDGRWFLPHFGLPNLKAKVLKVLGCDPNPAAVAKAVSGWDALDLEAAIDEARACGAMVRTNTEWLAHAHGQALLNKPVVEIIKLGDSDPQRAGREHPPRIGARIAVVRRAGSAAGSAST